MGLWLPSMLCWLATAIIPLVLARLALRRPRLVRWGASDLLAAAARSSHLTRGGLPWLLVLVRGLLLASAAAAAARPFLADHGTRLPPYDAATADGGNDRLFRRPTRWKKGDSRIVVLTAPPHVGTVMTAVPALLHAIESLAATDAASGGPAAGPRPAVTQLASRDLPRLAAAPRTLLIFTDQPPPTADDARRLTAAVSAGASLLVCLGPQAVGDEDCRRRTSAWLEDMAGITVEGRATLADSCVEVSDGLGDAPDRGARRPATAGAEGFTALPGPGVTTAAALGGRAATILARAAPEGLPLLVEATHGRGTVCVSALPMSLSGAGADGTAAEWSDLAAWPAFLPFVDRLVARLLAAATPLSGAAAASSAAAAIVPLSPALIAAAIAWLLADWWLSRRAAAGDARPRSGLPPALGRVAAAAILATMAAAWARPPTAAPGSGDRRRSIALLIDTSPSMVTLTTDAAPATSRPTRLAAVLAAIAGPAGNGGPLDRLARDRPVEVFTAATRLARLGAYPRESDATALRDLAAVPSTAIDTRIGDAVTTLLATADGAIDEPRATPPTAIVIASDGAITAGDSWATASRAAAGRRVPLVVIPAANHDDVVTADSLPPGFRITSLEPPRLCHAAEPFAIDVEAEATVATGPLEIGLAADPAAPTLARGTLVPSPAAGGMIARFAGRLMVPAAALAAGGSRLASPVLSVGVPGSPLHGPAAASTTCPLAVTDAAARVLVVDAAPRFEHRFLGRLLAQDAAFEVETCLLDPHSAGGAAAVALPRSIPDWGRFDVVVLGDVAGGPEAAGRADTWRSLREAAAADGIGIAWIPGGRWWNDPDPGLAWLPAVPGGMATSSEPRLLRATTGGRADDWLPPVAARAAAVPDAVTAFHPEVFAVLRPAALRPTARIIATVDPADAPSPVPAAAVIVDRLGSATILGHLCETWRWQRDDPQAYRTYWRRNLLRLAEPHQLGRLFPATLRVQPPASATGEPVRIEIVPTRAAARLDGWHLEVMSRGLDARAVDLRAADDRAFEPRSDASAGPRRIELPAAGLGGTTTVAIDGLPAGRHTVTLVPPADHTGPPHAPPFAGLSVDVLVLDPVVETRGGPAATAALEAAARASGGAVVGLDRIASLPETISMVMARAESTAVRREPRGGPPGWLSSPVIAHLLMAALVVVVTATWWQPRVTRSGAAA